MQFFDYKKKWIKYAFLNMLILLLIFGIAIFLICGAIYGTTISSAKNDAQEYAVELSNMNKEDVYKIAKGEDLSTYKDIIRPQYICVLYNVRADGTLELITENGWALSNNLAMRPIANYTAIENIDSQDFIVSQSSITDNGGNVELYIKILYSMANINNTQSELVIVYIIFAIILLVAIIGSSILLAMLEVKPLIESYEKQKVFINDISHEIRTPITIIKGNIENLIAESSSSDGVVNEALYDTLHEIEYMSEMTTGMLSIVRNSKSTEHKQDGSLSDIVRSVVDVYADMASMSNKSLVAVIDNSNLKISKEKIKQLLTILLDNSFKYTDEGDRIYVRLKALKNKTKITVSDTGIGVPEEELSKLFDRFYRAPNVLDKEGTGLGLSIAKSIVDSFDGTIYATANIPKGLSINIEFDNNKTSN